MEELVEHVVQVMTVEKKNEELLNKQHTQYTWILLFEIQQSALLSSTDAVFYIDAGCTNKAAVLWFWLGLLLSWSEPD